ncbi:MAG: family hydrolase [Rhizorhabdus sp.]|nr:family hydrolase [Rhizorhabdus sp.]
MKTLIAFDLDGTLAESKQAIDSEMAALLAGLTRVATVAVISGGDWPQFEKQLVGQLPADAVRENFVVMPTTGTKLYRFQDGAWNRVYADIFSDEEKAKILTTLQEAVTATGLKIDQIYGEQIEDRDSQITFSALGQQAPLAVKGPWDPDAAKRKALKAILDPQLPDCAINIGGASSIDITRKGIDKGYAVGKLAEATGIPKEQMLFLGDAIFPGGNDYPVKLAGVDTVKVRDVEETKRVVEALVLSLDRG